MYYKTLASLSRLELLHELQSRGPMTVAELAAATGLHQNTAREHLHRLIDVGFVRSDPIQRASRGRPELLYRTATSLQDPGRRARLCAAERRTRARVDRAGHQLEVLDDHMRQSGFDARIDPGLGCMTMRDCPFAELAAKDPRVCAVHRALIEDALRLVDGPFAVGDLHRHSRDRECSLDLMLDTGTSP